MKIKAIHVRRFRSLGNVAIEGCGDLNVFIGKNNAGKSNVLSTIDLVLSHLKRGAVAAWWESTRAIDEFTDRNPAQVAQIGIEFALSAEVNAGLRDRLGKEAPHLEKSIAQIEAANSISFIIALDLGDGRPFMCAERIGLGAISAGDELGVQGISLLRVDRRTGAELFKLFDTAQAYRADAAAVGEFATRGDYRFAFDSAEDQVHRRQFVIDQHFRGRRNSPARQRVDAAMRAAENVDEFRANAF